MMIKWAISLPFFLLSFHAWADTPSPLEDDKSIFNMVVENDKFADKDEGYTNGIRFAWLSSEAATPKKVRWAANHFLPMKPEGKKRISVAIGQSMYTPRNVTDPTLIKDDQPYAGWLYASLGIVSDTGKSLDNVMLTVGVVGPLSYAGETQKFVHNILGSPHPMGWHNQLHNELGVNFTYERKWRNLIEWEPFGIGFDVTPHVSGTVGNVNTDTAIGTMFRLGYHLPQDYGPPRIRPSLPGSDFFIPTKRLGGYIFSGIEGRGVARNIFLDGNSFRNSPHVDKEFLVGDLQVGIAITFDSMRLSYTQVFMTKEFETQVKAPQFGAFTFSYRF